MTGIKLTAQGFTWNCINLLMGNVLIFFLPVQTGDQEDVVVSNSDDEAEDTILVSKEPAAEAAVSDVL